MDEDEDLETFGFVDESPMGTFFKRSLSVLGIEFVASLLTLLDDFVRELTEEFVEDDASTFFFSEEEEVVFSDRLSDELVLASATCSNLALVDFVLAGTFPEE